MTKLEITENMDNDKDIEESEEEDIIPEKYSISSYGADYVVDMLVKRLRSNDIYVPPFQREFIWNIKQSSRFIESLLLGLPVPGIFLSKDDDSNRLLVIDGQQRLRTLQFFYDGIFGDTNKVFNLTGVQKNIENKTYKSLTEAERRQLDDSIIHATIIKQDEPNDDNSSVYYIFERLNTSGTPLTHQEIRATIFLGEFNKLLEKLNYNEDWRYMYGNFNKRRRDQEYILRFLALYYDIKNYQPPMRIFLNNFMKKNRHLGLYSEVDVTELFNKTIGTIKNYLDWKAFRPIKAFNVAVFDAVMVGMARRLEKGNIVNVSELKNVFDKLLNDPKFQSTIETGTTAQSGSVKTRIEKAEEYFSTVE